MAPSSRSRTGRVRAAAIRPGRRPGDRTAAESPPRSGPGTGIAAAPTRWCSARATTRSRPDCWPWSARHRESADPHRPPPHRSERNAPDVPAPAAPPMSSTSSRSWRPRTDPEPAVAGAVDRCRRGIPPVRRADARPVRRRRAPTGPRLPADRRSGTPGPCSGGWSSPGRPPRRSPADDSAHRPDCRVPRRCARPARPAARRCRVGRPVAPRAAFHRRGAGRSAIARRRRCRAAVAPVRSLR